MNTRGETDGQSHVEGSGMVTEVPSETIVTGHVMSRALRLRRCC